MAPQLPNETTGRNWIEPLEADNVVALSDRKLDLAVPNRDVAEYSSAKGCMARVRLNAIGGRRKPFVGCNEITPFAGLRREVERA